MNNYAIRKIIQVTLSLFALCLSPQVDFDPRLNSTPDWLVDSIETTSVASPSNLYDALGPTVEPLLTGSVNQIHPSEFVHTPAEPADRQPFGINTSRLPESALATKWHDIENLLQAEMAVLHRCRVQSTNCPEEARRFLDIVHLASEREGRSRLAVVNRAINLSIRPVSDFNQYGVEDSWTSPLTTFASGAGDCEDYAIAKYLVLLESGMNDDDLQLLIVRDVRVRADHALLAANLDGHWFLLDNRHFAIVDSNDPTPYVPLFAFNHDGVHGFHSVGMSVWVNGTVATEPLPAETLFFSFWP
jgi:predicted transglutaminase-like cysteine proteinase